MPQTLPGVPRILPLLPVRTTSCCPPSPPIHRAVSGLSPLPSGSFLSPLAPTNHLPEALLCLSCSSFPTIHLVFRVIPMLLLLSPSWGEQTPLHSFTLSSVCCLCVRGTALPSFTPLDPSTSGFSRLTWTLSHQLLSCFSASAS